MNQQVTPNTKALGVFTLSMISVSAIIALRNLPTFAIHGLSIVTLLLAATIAFLIPISLTCAELASGWPKKGGLYAWVTEAFGQTTGAVAIWLEWIESVVWLPTILTFIAYNLSYAISPALGDNKVYLFCTMITILWSGTLLNFLSIKTSSWVSAFGIIIGSIVPGVLIIAMGSYWLTSGQTIAFDISWSNLIPDVNGLYAFPIIGLAFAGIEVAAFYINDTENPRRTFPIATFIAAVLIAIIYTLGALALAVVIPKGDMNLTAGAMQAIATFFDKIHLGWATPVFAILSVLGGLALLNTWIIGPSRGLLASAENGDLPSFTTFTNKFGSPVAILLSQAIIGTMLIITMLFIPTLNSFYIFFTILAGQIIIIMYLLVFMSVIKLRYSQPEVERNFHIPGGKTGLWLIAGIGIIFCVVAFLFGFIPPEEYQFLSSNHYIALQLAGFILLSSPPLIWAKLCGRRD